MAISLDGWQGEGCVEELNLKSQSILLIKKGNNWTVIYTTYFTIQGIITRVMPVPCLFYIWYQCDLSYNIHLFIVLFKLRE